MINMARKRIPGKTHTIMRVSWKLIETLSDMEKYNETHEDVIWRLLKENVESVEK